MDVDAIYKPLDVAEAKRLEDSMAWVYRVERLVRSLQGLTTGHARSAGESLRAFSETWGDAQIAAMGCLSACLDSAFIEEYLAGHRVGFEAGLKAGVDLVVRRLAASCGFTEENVADFEEGIVNGNAVEAINSRILSLQAQLKVAAAGRPDDA